jgi:branched-chain amino acid transport system permease protein
MSATVDGSPSRTRLRRPDSPARAVAWVGWTAVLVVAVLAPEIFNEYWLSAILTQALWLGIAALSLIFLSSYGGMLSLVQVGIYGIAAFGMANLGTGLGGLSLGWDPWMAVIGGIVIGTLMAFVFGAIAARSYGIYFLMLTLALSMLVFYFFTQVTQLSGYGGVRNIVTPSMIGNPILHPDPLYYTTLAVAVACFVWLRYLGRTPFGLVMQGIRDDPGRMRALGYFVPLHRALAFTVAGFVASLAGILSVWFETQISPGSINIGQIIAILIIAVIGGLYRLEGAFVGALVYSILENYSHSWTPNVGTWLGPGRFETVLGVIFLLIVIASPGGLMGIYESAVRWLSRRAHREPPGTGTAESEPEAVGTQTQILPSGGARQ